MFENYKATLAHLYYSSRAFQMNSKGTKSTPSIYLTLIWASHCVCTTNDDKLMEK